MACHNNIDMHQQTNPCIVALLQVMLLGLAKNNVAPCQIYQKCTRFVSVCLHYSDLTPKETKTFESHGLKLKICNMYQNTLYLWS